MPEEFELRRLREAKSLYGKELLAHPDVHGVGIGYKKVGGKKTKELALVLHVYKKVPIEELQPSRRLPTEFSFLSRREKERITIPTDVREVIPPIPEVKCADCDVDFEDRVRPVPGGFSIGLSGVPGGTIGGYVWDNNTEQIVFISNEHVLGSNGGDAVIQPSASDGGSSPADDFGSVIRSGALDATIASVDDSDDMVPKIECSGPAVYEITDPAIDMEVEKVGQTTGLTCGVVDLIDYDSGHYGSHDDIWIDGNGSDFSQGGDSGSLYVEMNPPDDQDWKRIVGIHWGGSGNDGVGHPIQAVFNDLNLTTVCIGIVSALIEAILESLFPDPEHAVVTRIQRMERLPGPIMRKRKGGSFYVGFAQDFEKRIQESRLGSEALTLFRNNRHNIVKFLMDGDGWRSTVAALAPILDGKVTTDDVLEHRITSSDLENAHRVMKVAARVMPELKTIIKFGETLIAEAEGIRLRNLILSETRFRESDS